MTPTQGGIPPSWPPINSRFTIRDYLSAAAKRANDLYRRRPLTLFPHDVAPLLGTLARPESLFGAAGVALGCSWAMFSRRSAILACQSGGALAFAVYLMMIGSETGSLLCLVSLVQSLAAALLDQRVRTLGVVYVVTSLVVVAATWLTWSGLASGFAALGFAFATAGRLQRDPQAMRAVFFGSSTAWLGHNLLMLSAFGLVSDTLTLSSLALGLWRHRASRPVGALHRLPEPANDRVALRQAA